MCLESNGTMLITNCTFSGNYGIDGGALYINSPTVTINNSIFWGNTSPGISTIATGGSATVNLAYSDIEGGVPAGVTGGAGNITTNPYFVDALNGDFRLKSSTPFSNAIDAGSNALVLGITDLLGNARIQNGVVDMGAYENIPGSSLKRADEDPVDEAQTTAAFTLYPNPGKSSFQIKRASDDPAVVRVLDITGRTVLERSFSGAGAAVVFELGDAPAGIYLVELTSVSQTTVERWIKE